MGRVKANLKRSLGHISPNATRAAVQLNRSLQEKIRQLYPRGVDDSVYYPQQPDCQIASIAHLYSQFLGERENGTFVEIGANDGVLVSNTWGLAVRHWRGFMVEPIPAFAEACRRNHHQHPHVVVVETAVGDGSQSEMTLSLGGALTTANPEQKREYGSIPWSSYELTDHEVVVPAQSMDCLLEDLDVLPGFEVLVVDVEGLESTVFAGFALSKWRPQMMIVELADTHPQFSATRISDASLGRSILNAGYTIIYKDAINTVFVRADVWEAALASETH